jgi:hypothetical protein
MTAGFNQSNNVNLKSKGGGWCNISSVHTTENRAAMMPDAIEYA